MIAPRTFALWLVLAVVLTASVTATLTADVISRGTHRTVVIHRAAPRVHFYGTD